MTPHDSIQASPLEAQLGQRFYSLAISLKAPIELAQDWAKALIARYTEAHRHYHTLSHVNAMLACLDQNRALVHDETAVALAIFFHDWVYDVRSADNEVESAKVFEAFAGGVGLAEGLKGKVVRFIERTITHTLPEAGKDGDMELFLDFDLEVLSRSWDEYEAYAQQIRKEYSHYGEDDYRKGRAKVLRGFLERDRLYFSETFHTQREEGARQNMMREISELERGGVAK